MKTLITLIALTLSYPAFAGIKEFEALQARAGLYELSANDEENPCLGSDLKVGKQVRLSVTRAPEATQFIPKGDVVVSLEQFATAWLPLFDRPSFFRINTWSKRVFSPSTQSWINHKSSYDPSKAVLKNSVSINRINGSQAGIQTIQFLEEGRFLYTYDIVDYSAFGIMVKTTPAGRCIFKSQVAL